MRWGPDAGALPALGLVRRGDGAREGGPAGAWGVGSSRGALPVLCSRCSSGDGGSAVLSSPAAEVGAVEGGSAGRKAVVKLGRGASMGAGQARGRIPIREWRGTESALSTQASPQRLDFVSYRGLFLLSMKEGLTQCWNM